jgi:hypothetical protein
MARASGLGCLHHCRFVLARPDPCHNHASRRVARDAGEEYRFVSGWLGAKKSRLTAPRRGTKYRSTDTSPEGK